MRNINNNIMEQFFSIQSNVFIEVRDHLEVGLLLKLGRTVSGPLTDQYATTRNAVSVNLTRLCWT